MVFTTTLNFKEISLLQKKYIGKIRAKSYDLADRTRCSKARVRQLTFCTVKFIHAITRFFSTTFFPTLTATRNTTRKFFRNKVSNELNTN